MSKRIDPDQDLDQLLAPGAGEFGDIYRRLSRPEPPRRLDRVVLANAARAIHGDRAPRTQRWMLGLGSAAGVVLAAGIAWQVGRQLETQDQSVNAGAERARSQMIEVQPITEPAPAPTAGAEESDTILGDAEGGVMAEMKQAPAEPARRKAARPAPPPAAATPPPPPAPPPPAAAAAARPMVAPEPVETLSIEPEAQAFPLRKDAADAQVGDAGPVDQGKRLEQSTAARVGGFSAKSARAPEPAQSRAPAPTTSVQLRENMRLAPELWLAEIQRLLRQGHRQQAIENLRLFRRMHPDWQLSDELLRLSE
jgi:hypothetical protein